MLTAEGIEKTYRVGERRVSALRGVDLRVSRGQFVTILGRSGSGKSTLLTLLGGLSAPSQGRILWEGEDVARWSAPERAARVGYMFQFSGLLPTLTALENALLPARLAGRDRHEQAVEWLRGLGLGERLWALPNELSGGEQRRVAAVRAVINTPDLVLADEPTGDLDPESERQVMAFLREHAPTLILVTHNAELGRGSDQLLRMADGRLETLQALPPGPLEVSLPASPQRGDEGSEEEKEQRPLEAPPSKLLMALVLLLALLLVADVVTSHRQRLATQSRQSARKALERAAMFHLRADVGSVEQQSDGAYKVEIFLENPFPDKPLYLMPPEIAAYIQVGFNWVQVPLQSPADDGVLKVAGRVTLTYLLEPQVTSFEQVLPGYMHIRFSTSMRISLQQQPGPDGVARRSDNYYIYLQPPGADAVELARKNNFRDKAPLWISMPPH